MVVRPVKLGMVLLLRNGLIVLGLWLIAIRITGIVGGMLVLLVLAGVLGARVWRVIHVRKRIAESAKAAESAFAAGNYAEALKSCDAAVEIGKQRKAPPDDLTAAVLVLRSQVLQKLGRKDEALAAASQALACIRGVRRADTLLAILDQAGGLLLEARHERQAIPILEAAVGLGQRVDAQPLKTVARLERAGLAYSRVGLHANAATAFGKVVDLLTKQLGTDAKQLVSPYTNLGNAYKRLQKWEDAERCQREALRLLQANHVEDPEQVSIIMLNLGVVCAETGRNAEAEGFYQQVLEMRIAALGRNHWRVGNVYNNLANCRRRQRDFAGAEEYVQKAMEILESRPESLCNVMDTLSHLREEQGRMEEALAAVARAREMQQQLPTPDLAELAEWYEREALLAGRTGDEERAKDCRSRASQIRQSLAAGPPADNDLTNMPEALRTLEQHLQASLDRVKALETA